MNSFIYIAANSQGIVKIGLTDGNPSQRVKKFSKDYEEPFVLITQFSISNANNDLAEKFLHEIMNSQVFNVKFLQDSMNIVEFNKYIDNSPDGHTEIFLSKPIYILNSLTLLAIDGLLELTEEKIDAISKIKEYPIAELFKTNKVKMKYILSQNTNKPSILRTVTANKDNILKLNSDNFVNYINKDSVVSLKMLDNQLFISDGMKETNACNFLYGNSDIDNIKMLLSKSTLQSNIDMDSFTRKLKINNGSLSIQKNNTLAKKKNDNKKKVEYKNNQLLKSILMEQVDFIINDVESYHKEFFINLKEEIKNNSFFDKLNLMPTKKNTDALIAYENNDKVIKFNLQKISIIFTELSGSQSKKNMDYINKSYSYLNKKISNLIKNKNKQTFSVMEKQSLRNLTHKIFEDHSSYKFCEKHMLAKGYDLTSFFLVNHTFNNAIKNQILHCFSNSLDLTYLEKTNLNETMYNQKLLFNKNINIFQKNKVNELYLLNFLDVKSQEILALKLHSDLKKINDIESSYNYKGTAIQLIRDIRKELFKDKYSNTKTEQEIFCELYKEGLNLNYNRTDYAQGILKSSIQANDISLYRSINQKFAIEEINKAFSSLCSFSKEMIEEILNNKEIDVNNFGSYSRSDFLDFCIKNNDFLLLAKLTNHPNFNINYSCNIRSIMDGVKEGGTEIVKLLLTNHDLNINNDGNMSYLGSYLSNAILKEDIETIVLILSNPSLKVEKECLESITNPEILDLVGNYIQGKEKLQNFDNKINHCKI